MAAPRYLTTSVVVEVLDWDDQHWCPACLLPSGIRQWVVLRFPNGRMVAATRAWCDECGSRTIEITTDG